MARHLGVEIKKKLIRDILSARFDPVTLAEHHKISPEQLSQWIEDPQNRRLLGGLCVLADLQTQILLSRYRSVAAGRLIGLATGQSDEGGGQASVEVARRACVDLLRMELPRAEAEESPEVTEESGPEEGALRERLYAGLLPADRRDAGSGADSVEGGAR